MLDELNVLPVAGVARSLRLADVFDVASATKVEVAKALPGWLSERQRLNRDRVGRRETTEGDKLFVGLLRIAGVIGAVVVAGVAGWVEYTAAGPIAGIVAGAVGLAIALAAAYGAVVWSRALLDRSERTRREAVTQLDLGIRMLDERIGQAFRYHGLEPHTRTRTSY